MSEEHDVAASGETLGSIRQLEEALEAGSAAAALAEARLEDARAAAARILAEAREEAVASAAGHRRTVLDEAAREVEAIRRAGEERAARLRADARERRAGAVDVARTLILPVGDEAGA